jgi:hypothetical protein
MTDKADLKTHLFVLAHETGRVLHLSHIKEGRVVVAQKRSETTSIGKRRREVVN